MGTKIEIESPVTKKAVADRLSSSGIILKLGGPPETRTPDPLIKSQLLYQLS